MNIPKTLKETVSNIPEVIDENTIELTITKKWEVTKPNLITAKQNIENHINEKQTILDEINQYLVMLGEEIPAEGGDVMAYTSKCSVYRDHDHADDNATGDAELQMITIKEN